MIVLSVHLITYNNEKHIDDTLQSILKQKVDFQYEIVVGDDCSSDKTFGIIMNYAKKHPNLFSIEKNATQLGILKNFKTTLDRCSGTYVFDIAGDDFLNCEFALQKMVKTLKENSSLGFIDCGYDRFDEHRNVRQSFINKSLINSSKAFYKEFVKQGKVLPLGHCFKKEDLYKYVDFDTYLKMNVSIEDYPILVDMIMQSEFDRINESLISYRVHDYSHSHKKDFEFQLSQKTQMKMLFDYFANKYSFSKTTISQFTVTYYKALLFLAGYFEQKNLGKEIFSKIRSKNLKDYTHFLASQNHFFRKIISLRPKH